MKTIATAVVPKHARPTHRRIAVLVAALLTAVGAGLMAAPLVSASAVQPAAPAAKVGVCHATTSDSNPYVWIVVSTNSTRYQGHLMHRTDPPHSWKSDGTWNGIAHRVGDGKPDYVQGIDVGLTRDWCLGRVTPTPTTPTPTTPTPTTPTPTDTGTSTPTPTDTVTTTPPVDTGSPTPSTSSPAATTTAPEPGTTAPVPSTSGPGELAHTAGSAGSTLLVLSGLTLVGLGMLTMLAARRVGVHA